jgi:lipopolysaccharide transport system ATP-binding protein
MSDVVVQVDELGKCYQIAHRRKRGKDTLAEAVTSHFRGIRRGMRKLFSRRSPMDKEPFWALRDVSLQVKRGEVLGVIGRNGAGKSTLLKLLARITEPTTGRFGLRGRVASLLEVGTGFHPDLTGRENVYLNGAILGMRRAEITKKFDEIVAFAEIDQFLDTPVKRYSSGMYTRLAFAVAAHLEPEILIVDEVLAVGDSAFQKKCLGKMGEVARGGRTVLFVSHNMLAIKSLCNRVVWFDRGEICMEGDPENVVGKYLKTGVDRAHSRRWDSEEQPTSKQGVQLRYVAVSPCSENDNAPISVKTPLRFEFEFRNNLPGATLNFSVFLNEAERGCIFNTASGAILSPVGLVRGSFVVPGNFLNDGLYSLRLMLVKDTTVPILDVSDLIVFHVDDVVRQGDWFGKWVGAVRPAFKWECDVTALDCQPCQRRSDQGVPA